MRPLTLHSVCRNNPEPFRPVELLNPCAGDFSGTLQGEEAELERCGHCRRDYVYGALALRLARNQASAEAQAQAALAAAQASEEPRTMAGMMLLVTLLLVAWACLGGRGGESEDEDGQVDRRWRRRSSMQDGAPRLRRVGTSYHQ